MGKNLPESTSFINKTFPQFPRYKIEAHVGQGVNGHVFRAHNSSTNGSLAFKIIPVNNLPANEDAKNAYLNEAKKANVLENQSVVKYHDVFHYSEDARQYVIFVCDYVNGRNLDSYIKSYSSEITVQFVETFLRTIFGLLYELQRRNFPHGDLHAGNVLVAKSEYDINNRITFRVTDFGVQQCSEHPSDESDYLSVARTLQRLLLCIEHRECEGKDRFMLDALRNEFLKRHLIETDTSADPLACNPYAMLKRLEALDDEYKNVARDPTSPKLLTPFDYPNSEQMGNSHLLLKNLYSERFLGLSEIRALSNLMLTGPRGCGKTTVFHALSLDYLTSLGEDKPDSIDYIGVYYRCDDLYFAFPRYELPERPEALDIPMHFLISTLLASVLEQLSVWAQKYFKSEFERKEESLVSDLWDILELQRPNNPNANQIETLAGKLKKERLRAARKQRFVRVPTEPIENYFQPGVLIESCQYIRSSFSFLKDRPFYFFIDDYSAPKITMKLQQNLNRLVMLRSPDIFFKLSTESPVSFAREDIDGKKFVESREYDLVNLGLRYLIDKSDQSIEFLKDLFHRRFKMVEGYPVQTLEELLGSIVRNENETARIFREQHEKKGERPNQNKKPEKKEQSYYAGCETLAAMCSGDIHYMIRLVGRMVEDFGGQKSFAKSKDKPKIPYQQQHDTIRAAAGAFMESIRILPARGHRLAQTVTAFGKVAYSYLQYENSANESGTPPHQASRIEPYKALQLSDEAQEILGELLRYSILIVDPRGKSRRGDVVPRFYLRRYLIPHFNLTFSRRDSIQLENREIETLLCDPEKFEGARKLSSQEDAVRRRGGNPDQENLF